MRTFFLLAILVLISSCESKRSLVQKTSTFVTAQKKSVQVKKASPVDEVAALFATIFAVVPNTVSALSKAVPVGVEGLKSGVTSVVKTTSDTAVSVAKSPITKALVTLTVFAALSAHLYHEGGNVFKVAVLGTWALNLIPKTFDAKSLNVVTILQNVASANKLLAFLVQTHIVAEQLEVHSPHIKKFVDSAGIEANIAFYFVVDTVYAAVVAILGAVKSVFSTGQSLGVSGVETIVGVVHSLTKHIPGLLSASALPHAIVVAVVAALIKHAL